MHTLKPYPPAVQSQLAVPLQVRGSTVASPARSHPPPLITVLRFSDFLQCSKVYSQAFPAISYKFPILNFFVEPSCQKIFFTTSFSPIVFYFSPRNSVIQINLITRRKKVTVNSERTILMVSKISSIVHLII